MRAAIKKTTGKAPPKTTSATSKAHAAVHPPWVDMIKACIIAHSDDARAGVSRPTIKKFVESKYRIELNAAASSQLNRAITTGSEKGTFVLPKGPSGKVKLAPKARADAAKENTKPVSKRSAGTKPVPAKPKAALAKPTATKKTTTGRLGGASKATTTAKNATTKPTGTTKKYTSSAKKPPVKKATPTTKKTAAAKKPSTTTKKSTTVKKGIAKKTVTGETKKPAAVKSKAKPASKKPTSKAKPASKSAATKKPASNKA